MNEVHIHEVLRMMIDKQKNYTGKTDFVKDITEIFGSDTRFFACSGSGMDANAAFDFLLKREKINLNTENKISINPTMTMCDEDKPHHHHHHH